jgi:iron(III) transport system permease protein
VTPIKQEGTPWQGFMSVGGTMAYAGIFLVLAFLVLYPGFQLVLTSLQDGHPSNATAWTLRHWSDAFAHKQIMDAVNNTLTLSVARQGISMLLGIAIAWLIVRTNLPGRQWIEVGFWIALFMPALPVSMAWVLLAGGEAGILNAWIKGIFPNLKDPIFNVYSWWGIVWLHLVTSTLPVKVFLLAPALRAMDSAMEEAARTCGSGLWGMLFKIVVPLMLPTLLAVLLLGFIRSMQAFEIELILGTPASIDVYSTMIYRAMKNEPPDYGMGSALSLGFVALVIPFVIAQQWFSHRYAHATVGGKFSSRIQDLGKWKWPLFWSLIAMLAIMTVLPTVMLLMGSFMKIFGVFNLNDPWTLRHWIAAFARDDLLKSFVNSMLLGGASAMLGMALYSLVAYYTVKTQYYGRRALDFLTWIPTVIPGIVISLAILQMFIAVPVMRLAYGTIWAMVLAVLLGSMTVGVQITRGGLVQLKAELEEASWTSGASRLYTFLHVVLPLVAPAVIVVGLQIFATAVSVVSVVALLGTGDTQPLSLLQLAFLDSGKFESATIVGLLVLVITMLAAMLARFVSSRYGLENA